VLFLTTPAIKPGHQQPKAVMSAPEGEGKGARIITGLNANVT